MFIHIIALNPPYPRSYQVIVQSWNAATDKLRTVNIEIGYLAGCMVTQVNKLPDSAM